MLDQPGGDKVDTRGLVLGYVQSGKTTSFMSVIAKAADAGYRVFIILSGITDNLRSQTQARVDEMLVGMSPEERARWHWLTDADKDFSLSPQNAANILKNRGIPRHRRRKEEPLPPAEAREIPRRRRRSHPEHVAGTSHR